MGRDFESADDRPDSPRVAILSHRLWRRRFGSDPAILGRRISLDDVLYSIVGVLPPGFENALAPAAEVWTPLRYDLSQPRAWDVPVDRVATMDELLARSGAERRFALILFEAFALAALALAAIGIYGVQSGSVAARTREIGLRSALGASRSNILALVLRQGMELTAAGAAIGLVGAVAASQALVTLLFGVSRLDPATYAGVVALLLAVSALACWLPAWRATRVDPAITLRAE